MPPSPMPDRLRLPLQFDAARLQADLARMTPEDWTPHFNTREFEGEWSGVAFRSVDGVERRLYPDPAAQGRFADTPALERCPSVRQVLSTFACPVHSARFLKLAAGARIREHRDYRLGYADGEVRLHIPVTTHPGVAFFLAGQRVVMAEGECWYLDVNQPHRVENPGPSERVHLVVDCVVDDWLRALFERAAAALPQEAPSSRQALEHFRQRVLSEPALQEPLRAIMDAKEFPALLVRLGAEHGYTFTPEDVQEALRTARRAWRERWV